MGDPDETEVNGPETTPGDLGSESQSERPAIETLRADIDGLEDEIETLTSTLEALESDVETRTVHRETIESDLKQYVRARIRRGHARGWGPYLVLLYGTVMTIGAFAHLSGGWSILAMIVVWLSTLGLYVLMVLTGIAFSVLSLPGRTKDLIGTAIGEITDRRS